MTIIHGLQLPQDAPDIFALVATKELPQALARPVSYQPPEAPTFTSAQRYRRPWQSLSDIFKWTLESI